MEEIPSKTARLSDNTDFAEKTHSTGSNIESEKKSEGGSEENSPSDGPASAGAETKPKQSPID